MFPGTASLCLRSRRGKDNSLLAENRRTRITAASRSIDHVYHLGGWHEYAASDPSTPQHTAYLDGRFQFQQDRLVDKDFSCFCTQRLDLVFLELDRLPGSVATH